ncbi:RasGEF domain-containing protein [Legionella sp. km772]|uniref:RasGEF domain-containing protein n=1 Tax=Legionella sp. km772 TaxID=2498111 RepID=UPI000F8D510B|nr:RasGEF domain-containing protein [Legionella sp. km772]RUR05116.1 hypothetical protein ELY15_14710 [Legionella sp. km772]
MIIFKYSGKKCQNLKKIFLNWLKNFTSLAGIDATTWDDKITNEPTAQKAIRKSAQIQACYAYIESNLAHQYAKIITTQLNNAFYQLNRLDFMVPKGFSDRKKGSVQLQDYLRVKDLQEQFIRTEILKNNDDARIHAFRRWIAVVEILVKRHHYEAAFNTLLTLSTLDDQYKLSRHLPSYNIEVFDSLLKLVSPMGNFRVLRQCIKEARGKNTTPVIFPFVIFSKDLTNLNEHLGDDQAKSLKDITRAHPSYVHFATREDMLDELMSAQPKEPSILAEPLQNLFDKFSRSITTESSTSEDASSVEEFPLALNTNTRSTLYSQKLHPTLWSKRARLDKTDHSYWKDMFQVGKLPTPLQ